MAAESVAKRPFHIAIVGGGITGLALAIALQKRHISCTVYEQAGAFGEIGAGVGMHPNAVRAMRLCDPAMLAAFDRVSTRNKWPSKQHVWFDFLDATSDVPARDLKPLFSILGHHPEGHAACHRARFLDELVRLLPADIARFNKRLATVLDGGDPSGSGRLTLKFEDGTTAEADAVIGCDGIKSRTREVVVGSGPHAKPSYSFKFVYRGLIPMEDAIEALGEEKAANSSLWMGPNRHVLTFPVNHGATMNLVAFVTTDKKWPSETNMTLPSTREDSLADFEGFSDNILRLIKLTQNKPDRWGLFDLAEHPVPTFYKGRVCLVGDAAHASTPHHGAGAGFCIEDVAVLSALLADERVCRGGAGAAAAANLEAVFAAFDAARRERDHWLVQSSRRVGDLYEWRADGLGRDDVERIAAELRERQTYIWDVDLEGDIAKAREDLGRRLRSV